MRILFAYRYGLLGGVCTQLVHRMRYLGGISDLHVEFLFAEDHGIPSALSSHGPVHIEPDPDRAKKLAKAGGHDLLVVVDTPEYLEAFEAIEPRVPIVCEVHTTTDAGLAYLDGRRYRVQCYVVPSLYSRSMLVRRFGFEASERVHIVPNIVDSTLFRSVRIDTPHRRPIVLWVGKLDDHKNWECFLEVGALLRLEHLEIELWLVGGETAQAETALLMLETVEGLGLCSRFRWFPRVEHGAMPRMYSYVARSGGCTIVTSKDESFGMSVAESLLSGCPVVASRVGGIPEIAPGAAYLALYDLGDSDGARRLVQRVLLDRALGTASSALLADAGRLKARFHPATIGPTYLEVLRGVAREGGTPGGHARARLSAPRSGG